MVEQNFSRRRSVGRAGACDDVHGKSNKIVLASTGGPDYLSIPIQE
jgi:hypothetical protein